MALIINENSDIELRKKLVVAEEIVSLVRDFCDSVEKGIPNSRTIHKKFLNALKEYDSIQIEDLNKIEKV